MTADEYLRRVDLALGDLPWGMRRHLLSELREHLAELPPGTGLTTRLGAPEQYAADLRAAAELGHRRGPVAFLRARRPRDLILTALALTLIGLAIGAVAWIQSYQPLAFGNGFRYPTGARDDPGGTGQYVVFHQGRPFQFGVTIRNAGPFTVRVLGLPRGLGAPFNQLVTSTRLLISRPMPNGGFPSALVPFHPFDLKPGEERAFVVEGIYDARCSAWRGGGSAFAPVFPIRFGFLWRSTTVQLTLSEPLAIVVRKGGGGCR